MDQALFFQEPRSYNLQHKTCHSETSYFTLECGLRRKVQIADESDHRSYEECLSTRGGRNKCFRSFFSCSPKKYLLLKAMPLDFPPFPRNGREICVFFSTSLSILYNSIVRKGGKAKMERNPNHPPVAVIYFDYSH